MATAKSTPAPPPRINVGISRDVHQAVKDALVKDETLVGFIETLCKQEVQRRSEPQPEVIHLSGAPLEMPMPGLPGMTLVETRTPPLEVAKPASELDELKTQMAQLMELVTKGIPEGVARAAEDLSVEPIPGAEEHAAIIDRTAFTPEMVIDWELVPANVPDGSRLITEADDDNRAGVMVQFWRLSTGKSLKTSTRGSVLVPAQEPVPGGPKPSGNAQSGGLPAGPAGFDTTLNTPEDAGPLSPMAPSRTAPAAIEDELEPAMGGIPALVTRRAYVNEAGRTVRPSDPTRSQATRIAMLNDIVDGARMGSNAPKQAEAAQARPSPVQPGNPTPPTRPAVRRPAQPPIPYRAPTKPVPRASFE